MNIHIIILIFFLEITIAFFAVRFISKGIKTLAKTSNSLKNSKKTLQNWLRNAQFGMRYSKDKTKILLQLKFASKLKTYLNTLVRYIFLLLPFIKKGKKVFALTMGYELVYQVFQFAKKTK